jgi:dTDP-4-dehydrorhamnose 3,5-epimerase-like enzyme
MSRLTRRHSPTFCDGMASSQRRQPHGTGDPGFAHGFQTLTDDCEPMDLHTAVHAPAKKAECTRRIRRSPSSGRTHYELSARDAGHPLLR